MMGADRGSAVGTLTPSLKRQFFLGAPHSPSGSGNTAFWSWRHGLLLLNGKVFIILCTIGQEKNDKRLCYGAGFPQDLFRQGKRDFLKFLNKLG